MLVCINKSAGENDDEDDENEEEIKVTRVCRFTASIIFYFNTAKSTYNIQKYQALPHQYIQILVMCLYTTIIEDGAFNLYTCTGHFVCGPIK